MNTFIISNEYNHIKLLIPTIKDNNELYNLYNLYLLIYSEKAKKRNIKKRLYQSNTIKIKNNNMRLYIFSY